MIARRGLMIGAAAAAALTLRPLNAGPVATRPPRLLAFGDSLTAGFGLPSDQGLVPVLSRWLADNGRSAKLVNAGLSGDTTYGGRIRIGWSILRGADAIMVELGGNDMLTGIPVSKSEANLDAILTRATANGRPVLLVGIQAPPGDPEWRQEWADMWPRLADRHGVLLWSDLYAPISALPHHQRVSMLQSDGTHPSAAGVRLIVDALGPKVRDLLDAVKTD